MGMSNDFEQAVGLFNFGGFFVHNFTNFCFLIQTDT